MRTQRRSVSNEFLQYVSGVGRNTGDAYDNEAFLEHFSRLEPLHRDWADTVDSDATLSPSPSWAPPSQAPQPQAPTPSQAPSTIPLDIGSTSRRGRGKNKNTTIGNLSSGQKLTLRRRNETNALNMAKVTYVNYSGSINFPKVESRIERDTGSWPDLAELFLAVHSKKSKSEDGSIRSVSNDEVQSKATQLGETSAANSHLSHFEVVESVFWPQSHGRVIVLGSGLIPTSFRTD